MTASRHWLAIKSCSSGRILEADSLMEDFLRIYLLGGLVLHKLVWEVLKQPAAPRSGPKKIIALNLPFLMKVAKVVLLAFLILQILLMEPIFPISQDPEEIILVGLCLYSLGLLLAITGRLQLGSSWSNIEEPVSSASHQLVDRGLYKYIRHPIYTGDTLLVFGLELALNSWFVLLVLPLVVVVFSRAKKEEQLLVESLPEYRTYQERSKMFLPYIV